MLPTEKEKLQTILDEVLQLGQSTLDINKLILEKLEHCQPCLLADINKIPKKERYSKIDLIDNLIIKVFALYTPEARDLRELIAFLKITNEFDRIANSSNSFIRDFPIALSEELDHDLILEYAIPLQKSSVVALEYALKLLALDDLELVDDYYSTVSLEESKNDDLYKIIEKTLLKKINNDMHLTKDYQDVMAALRRLEKVADRALSIANLMHYAKLGGVIRKT